MIKPLVSIGIPTYNRPNYLKKAIVSALQQTYQNLEVIISDNCTPGPEVGDLVKSFVSKDNRITFYKQEENIGSANNFNFVLKKARGDYFIWMADDDECENNYIEKMMEVMLSNPNVVLCASDIKVVDENGNFIRNEILSELYPNQPWTKKPFFTYPISNVFFVIYGLYRKEVLLKLYNHKLPSYKEYITNTEVPYLAKVALMGRIVAIPGLLKIYRSHKDSVYIKEYSNMSADEFSKLRYYTRKRLIGIVLDAPISFGEKIYLLKNIYISWIKGRDKLKFHQKLKVINKTAFFRFKTNGISLIKKVVKNYLPSSLKRKIIRTSFFLVEKEEELQPYFKLLLNSITNNNNSYQPQPLYTDRKKLVEMADTYPSIINNGYRHIEKVIELVNHFNLDTSNSIIDVGGAGGEVSILFSKAFPEATIYTFEPIRNTFEKARENIQDYPNIKLKNVALGSQSKKMNIQVAERITSSSLFMINEQIEDEYLAKNIKKKGEEEIEIQVLDEVLSENEHYNLIKLDVQGYELEVLKGSIKTLKRTKFVLLEMQNHNNYLNAPRYYELDEFLRNQDFELFDMIPSIRKGKQIYEWDGIYINTKI